MKLDTILLSLAAVATTAVTNATRGLPLDYTLGLPLNYTLIPNAVELLRSNGLWAPDPAAFAAGTPNVDNVNITAEVERFRESGLDANDIVTVSIDNTAAVGGVVALDRSEGDPDCEECNGCQVGCIVLVIFLPFWGACIGGCMKSDYCNGCGLD